MDETRPDFSGRVRVFVSRREMLGCGLPRLIIARKLYRGIMDLEKPIDKCKDFLADGLIFQGSVDESRWPLTPTVLG